MNWAKIWSRSHAHLPEQRIESQFYIYMSVNICKHILLAIYHQSIYHLLSTIYQQPIIKLSDDRLMKDRQWTLNLSSLTIYQRSSYLSRFLCLFPKTQWSLKRVSCVMVQMKHVPHRLMYLNTWCQLTMPFGEVTDSLGGRRTHSGVGFEDL